MSSVELVPLILFPIFLILGVHILIYRNSIIRYIKVCVCVYKLISVLSCQEQDTHTHTYINFLYIDFKKRFIYVPLIYHAHLIYSFYLGHRTPHVVLIPLLPIFPPINRHWQYLHLFGTTDNSLINIVMMPLYWTVWKVWWDRGEQVHNIPRGLIRGKQGISLIN